MAADRKGSQSAAIEQNDLDRFRIDFEREPAAATTRWLRAVVSTSLRNAPVLHSIRSSGNPVVAVFVRRIGSDGRLVSG